MSRTGSIPRLLEPHPRAGILRVPIVIHELPRLSAILGCRLYVLRDDQTGFALGGNKTRKLDFLVGDALHAGADTLITTKATSFSRNAAAAACAWDLDLHVVLDGTEVEHNPLSRQLFELFGTKLHYTGEPEEALDAAVRLVSDDLRAHGHRVYELHPGGSDPVGALSYVEVFHDIVVASERLDVHFSHIVHSTGSAGTQAGLVVGQKLEPYETTIIGVCASRPASIQRQRVEVLAGAVAERLGTRIDESSILVDDTFIGPGYAIASDEGNEAAALLARTEGLLLDPVYTGKAAAALIHYASTGRLSDGAALFIHTGGNGGLFY